MAIQSTGIGSGLDVNSIITQLLAIEARPLARLQQSAGTTQTQLSTYGTLKSRIAALGDAAEKLATAATWNRTRATSTDTAALTVTATGSATPVKLQVEVSQLAQAQSVATTKLPSAGTPLGTGTLMIEWGRWNEGFQAFTPTVPLKSASIEIGSGEDTLAGIRDKINAADAGVTAAILNDSQGSRLVLRSTATGAESGFRITVTDDDGNGLDDSGLSRLAFDPPAGAPASGSQRAVDLVASVNGAAVISASNQLDELVDGVSLQISRTTTAPVSVDVERDTEALKSLVQQFVGAYNEANRFLAAQTRYNADTKTSATLQGDRTAVTLQGQLRALVAAQSGASSVFGTLSSAGISLQRDGSLAIDDGKLASALGNLPELARLFSADGSGNPQAVGIARRSDALADLVAGTGGALESREDGLKQRLARNRNEQDRFNDRMAMVEARLRAQYTVLDRRMAQLNGLSAFVTQQVELLNRSNSRG